MLSLLFFFNCIGKVILMSGRNIKFIEIFQKLNLSQMCLFIGIGRAGWGGGGGQPPNNLRGGGSIPFAPPPNNPPTFSFNFYVKQEKITNVPS